MTKTETRVRIRRWTVKRSRALNLARIGLYAFVTAATWTVYIMEKRGSYVPQAPFAEGVVWGGFGIIGVMGLAISLGHRRVITHPAPLPIDPANPPTPGVFLYDPEDPQAPEVRCYCHNVEISNGQEVVSWPQPPKYTCANKADR